MMIEMSDAKHVGLRSGGAGASSSTTWTEQTEGEGTDEENKDDFYDLSLLTNDEKLGLIKMAYSLTQYGDGINWDLQRDNFIETVLEGKSNSQQSKPSQGSADLDSNNYDDEYDGNLDDTLDGQVLLNDDDDTTADDDAYNGQMDDTLDGETTNNMIAGNKDAYHGMLDDTLGGRIMVTSADDGLTKENYIMDGKNDNETPVLVGDIIEKQTSRRRLQETNNIDGDVFDGYEYSKGACPNVGSLGVPCAPDNIASLCNKYDRTNGSFRACIDACKPAFCCIHDAPRQLNTFAPNCNTDENCDQYNYCYIAWWKLHDTVGPALFLRVEQDDEFYDIDAEEIEQDNAGDTFFTQVLLHHFDDIDAVIEDGTVDNEFKADRIFLDEDYW
eukprot:CAMPEP_0172302018 /NCGR_PEP_ID=MMETSP1058-20130122/3786_1 /TAXON_ID=83371 /ORGANISM="Detonula confervacea, Strain CCMP 353" /LENGTH=385 /DNA_ID=CAMNT_0013012345 /DNA_START=66 /DNA_END=1220 /DNA_ORIENTATION=+